MPEFDEVTRLIGFDFGHGETSVARLSAALNAEPYVAEISPGKRVITTAVGTMRDGTVAIGNQALLWRDVRDVNAAFKSANIRDPQIHRATSAFVAAVLSKLSQGTEPVGQETLVVFGHPSGWTQPMIDGYAQLLRQTAAPSHVFVMPESRAAFLTVVHEHGSDAERATLGERVLIVDIGSSTTDFTVAHGERTENALGDTGNFNGVALGASLIEEFLLERCVSKHKQERKIRKWFAGYPTERIRSLIEFRRRKEDFFTNEEDFRREGRSVLAAVRLLLDREVDLEFSIRIEDFDDALNSPLSQLDGDSWLGRYRRDLKSIAESLDGPATRVILTGGGSRMECTLTAAKELFPAPTDVWRAGQPEHAVSLGLARGGAIRRRAEGFRHAIDEIVANSAIKSLIIGSLPEVPPIYANWYAHEAYDVVARHLLGLWRSGEIETLKACTERVNSELPVHLATPEAVRRFDEQLIPWRERLQRAVLDLVREESERFAIPVSLVEHWTVALGKPPSIYPQVQGASILGRGGEALGWGSMIGLVATGALIGSAIPIVGTFFGALAGAAAGIVGAGAAEEAFLDRHIPVSKRASFTDEVLRRRMAEDRQKLITRVTKEIKAALVPETSEAEGNREVFTGAMVSQIEEALKAAAARIEILIR